MDNWNDQNLQLATFSVRGRGGAGRRGRRIYGIGGFAGIFNFKKYNNNNNNNMILGLCFFSLPFTGIYQENSRGVQAVGVI